MQQSQEPERYLTNMFRLAISDNNLFYYYLQPMSQPYKCTMADGSVYWQRMISNDKRKAIRSEKEKLYLDKECTKLAPVTRSQKLAELKERGVNSESIN
jgi:hypothetical protein